MIRNIRNIDWICAEYGYRYLILYKSKFGYTGELTAKTLSEAVRKASECRERGWEFEWYELDPEKREAYRLRLV